jgi:intein/homing endonuclease
MGVFRDGYFWHRIRSIEQVEAEEVIGFQMDREVQVCIDDDAEAHGTFCTWGMAGANSNYIPIMPLPIGNQTIGGDGKGLLMAGEIQQWSEWIITGMGVPREFLQGGLCLSQNSMVFTDRGLERLSEIRESGSAQRRVVTHEGIGEASQLHQPGRKKVFRVRTRFGLMLDGASTHKLLTLRRDLTEDFTQIGSMTGGEYVAVKVGANLWPTDPFAVSVALTKVGGRYANRTLEEVTIPREVTPELARILGYLTSEGYCASPRRMSFSNTDKVLFDDFVTCMQYVFNITLGMYLEEYDTVNSLSGKKTKYKTEISRQTVVEFLQGLGLSTDSYGKNVPECIRLSPKNIVANFLRAYFDGDGGVSASNGKLCVAAHSVSEELLQEVQLLLLKIGVVSSLYSPYPTKSTYTLQIRSEFGRKYLDEVGATSPAKAAVGELEIETRTAGNCSNTVPFLRDALLVARDRHVHGFGSWRHEPVDAVLSKEEYTVDEVAHLLRRERSSISGYIRKGSLLAELKNGEQGRFDYYVIKAEDLQRFMRTRGVGKRRTFAVRQYEYGYDTLAASDLGALKTLEPELYSRVKLLQDQAFFWDEVVSVEELELEEEMLDLGVEGSHSYQANGIIGHNSWAGTNVSMRMLENAFLGYIIRHKAMAKWVMQSIASFMKWPEVNIRFKPFKMADDLQRKAYRFQLNMAQKLSDTTLLADDDLDQEEENKIMERETATRLSATKAQQLAMAKIQGEQQLIMMKYQAKAQEAMTTAQGAPAAQGEPGGPETMDEGAPGGQMAGSPAGQTTTDQAQGGAPQGTNSPLNQGQQLPPGTQSTVDIPAMAYQYAQQIAQMPPNQQQMTIQTMQQSQPELVDLVIQMLAQMGIKLQSPQPMQGVPGAAGKAATEINMNPLPDVLPPRRAAGAV